jgi:hypothetical protein
MVHPDRCKARIPDQVLQAEITSLFTDAYLKLKRAHTLLQDPESLDVEGQDFVEAS